MKHNGISFSISNLKAQVSVFEMYYTVKYKGVRENFKQTHILGES